MVSIDQTQISIPSDNCVGLDIDRSTCSTGGLLTMNRNYQRDSILPKSFVSLMRSLSLCPHANAGWPIRCAGEAGPSQHCYDCGAQRTYVLQPLMRRGPWTRPQPYSTYPIEVAFSSSLQNGPISRELLAVP